MAVKLSVNGVCPSYGPMAVKLLASWLSACTSGNHVARQTAQRPLFASVAAESAKRGQASKRDNRLELDIAPVYNLLHAGCTRNRQIYLVK